MKIVFSTILKSFGYFAITVSIFQAMAKDYDLAFWSLLYGVVFVELSRLLTKRAPDLPKAEKIGNVYPGTWEEVDKSNDDSASG